MTERIICQGCGKVFGDGEQSTLARVRIDSIEHYKVEMLYHQSLDLCRSCLSKMEKISRNAFELFLKNELSKIR